MQFSGSAGTGDSNHWTFKLPAEQFSCEKIVAIYTMTPLWILFRFLHLLYFEEQFVTDNARDAALDADVIIDVNAPVPLVM